MAKPKSKPKPNPKMVDKGLYPVKKSGKKGK